MKNISILRKAGMMALAIGILSGIGTIEINAQSAPAPGSGGSFNPAPANGIGWNPGPGTGNSAPAPGSGGSFKPAPVGGPNGIGWNPGPSWNNPGWNNPGWNGINNPSAWTNQGTENVMACGYDAQGIWRTIPLQVAYTWTGFQYDVTVLNAWNPWTSSWNIGVDMPAYNTSYYINGNTYDFYTPLSTGTYYFNL